jgi:hypothetical protein
MISGDKGLTMRGMTTQKDFRHRYGFMVTAVVALIANYACGGKDVQPTDPDPPWVAEYQKTVRAGCECKAEACFSQAKEKLDKLVSDHGGFDEVPLSVHEAHKKFDPCWREGTADLARDLSESADAICRCTDSGCVQSFRVGMVALEDKYGTNFEPPLSNSLDENIRTELERADKCLSAISIPAADFLAYMQETTGGICACTEIECMQKILAERMAKFKGRHFIDGLPAIQSQLDASKTKYCSCIGKDLAVEIADKVNGGVHPQLKVRVICQG